MIYKLEIILHKIILNQLLSCLCTHVFGGHPQGRREVPRCPGGNRRYLESPGPAARVPSPRGLKKRFHSHPWGYFNRKEVHPASGELDQLPLQFPASVYFPVHRDSEGTGR